MELHLLADPDGSALHDVAVQGERSAKASDDVLEHSGVLLEGVGVEGRHHAAPAQAVDSDDDFADAKLASLPLALLEPVTGSADRPPVPPFTRESATQKVRMAEDAWNTRDPERVALAYTADSAWRNRAEFLSGREAIVEFLRRKWARELDYRLIKELWAFVENRIAVRFAYEWRDDSGFWFRSYGNENWEFDEHGLMRRRIASINDLPIGEAERRYRWPLGRRPDDHPGLSDLGL
jgi:nuclear transport factor 2 (NTF2) superfamily protein